MTYKGFCGERRGAILIALKIELKLRI